MTVAIASGKGGTGKTTIAVSLALSRAEPLLFLDCDVEEPNAALFLSESVKPPADLLAITAIHPTRRAAVEGLLRRSAAGWEVVRLANSPDVCTPPKYGLS